MKRNKLLIIDTHQLGTLTDVYKWCLYLRSDYEITLLCFDAGFERIEIEGVHVNYISYKGILPVRGIRFLLHCIWNICFFQGKILIVYFEHCDILKMLFPFKRMLVDIRTLSISPNTKRREKSDVALINACHHFDMISVISEGVEQKLKIINKPISILPLGADCISTAPKDYSTLKLLYVGTFSGRNLDETLKGLALFCRKYPDVNIEYDIIGSGSKSDNENLRNLTKLLKLEKRITFYGRIPNHSLAPYFAKANIGVSFIPITEYYNYQPPTKTFEYALSGLYTIATATEENQKIISTENGILIQDTSEGFCYALEAIYFNRYSISEKKIRESLKKSTWANVINNHLKPILDKL